MQLTSSVWCCYAFTLLVTTTVSSMGRFNHTLGPCVSRSNRTPDEGNRSFLHVQAFPIRRRFRREGAIQWLSDTAKEEVVERHNYYRRNEGASNMLKLKWNDYLAEMAVDWAKACSYVHGQPPRDEGSMPYSIPGQNLFAAGADTGLPYTVDDYMTEKKDFDRGTMTCNEGKDCGHYQQIVWAITEAVGCAYAKCDSLANFRSNSYLYVCNYGPGLQGLVMYEKEGPACSKCVGSQWCDDGLCVSDCKGAGKQCVCGSSCKHCGKADRDTCSCKCDDGYQGPDCAEKCTERQDCPNMPASECSSNAYLRQVCPGLCGICKVAAPGTPEKNCPVDRIDPSSDSSVWLRISLQQLLIVILLLLCL